MVVPLLLLVFMQTCTNRCIETSQRMRKREASNRTTFVVKQRKRSWWQNLRSAVWQRSQSSCFIAKRGDRQGISTCGKTPSVFWSWWLLGDISFSTYRHYFVSSSDLCHLAVVGQWKQYACALKIVTGLQWKCLQISIFCMVIAHSFLFLLLLCHHSLLFMLSRSHISNISVWSVIPDNTMYTGWNIS